MSNELINRPPEVLKDDGDLVEGHCPKCAESRMCLVWENGPTGKKVECQRCGEVFYLEQTFISSRLLEGLLSGGISPQQYLKLLK